MFGGNAFAFVPDSQYNLRPVGLHEDVDHRALAGAAIADGVADQIFRQLEQLAEVPPDRRQVPRDGRLDPASCDEETIRDYLYDSKTPDPDLLIRTAGEMRVSNFLLWQISYSEFYVAEACWPDFRKPQLMAALQDYASRVRKFGGLIAEAPLVELAAKGRGRSA